jgi:hypothetical protein
VPWPLSSDEALCAGAVLLSGWLGFFGGRMKSFRDLSHRVRLGAVIEARAFAHEPPRPELPAVPSGVVGGSVLSIVACVWLHCRELIYQHLIFTAVLVACAISSGVWLMMAASIQNAADRERHARIEEFIADPDAPVPPPVRGLESMPAWFDLWSWINIVVFFCLMGRLVLLLLPSTLAGQG